MESLFNMIEDRKRILKVFRYCRQHSVHFSAKCEELICIESKLILADIRRVLVKVKTPFEEWARREICLVMRVGSSSFEAGLVLPRQSFSFSFQYRSAGHSFDSRLISFNHRAHLAVFSFPQGIYKRRRRETLRIPVTSSDGIQVVFKGQVMEVFNLTLDGAGLFIPSASFFRIGQVLPGLSLLIQNERFLATGRIRHISTIAPGKCICGMTLNYVGETAADRIREFIVEKQLETAGVKPAHRLLFKDGLFCQSQDAPGT